MKKSGMVVELAVESLQAVRAAAAGGADRVELCADLSVGGLTPSDELVGRVLDDVAIPVFPMVRSRAGDFTYSQHEVTEMCRTLERMRRLGVHGAVTGALNSTRDVDGDAMRALLAAAGDMPVTFHRAFDRVADQAEALETLIELGVKRVLTSGGARTALEGTARLRALVVQSAGRIAILAGAGVRASNVRQVVAESGVNEVHSRLIDAEGEVLTAERVQGFVHAATS